MEEKKNFPEDKNLKGVNRSDEVANAMSDKIKGSTLGDQAAALSERKRPPLPGGTSRDPNLKHAEAFCHMQYFGRGERASVQLTIWNSRDGVTPMFVHLPAFPGVQFSHVNWQNDSYDPGYKPKKGDWIFRTWTDEEIETFAGKQFDEMLSVDLPALEKMSPEQIQSKYGYDSLAHLREITAKGKDAWVKMSLQQYGGRGEPTLVQVTEDWS